MRVDRRLFLTGAAGLVTGAAGLTLAGCDRVASSKHGPERLRCRGGPDLRCAARRRRTGRSRRNTPHPRSALSSSPTARLIRRTRPTRKWSRRSSPPIPCRSGASSRSRVRSRWPISRACLPARRSHGTIASRAGVASANGPGRHSMKFSTLCNRSRRHATSCSIASTPTRPITRPDPVDPNTLNGDSPQFYGSIDLKAAVHPQTILAYDMNGQPLPVEHGAPLRVRVERQLGYKNTKYIKSIELVASYAELGDGKGGYWEDNGYEWYGGI